jgi:hypothetical protein
VDYKKEFQAKITVELQLDQHQLKSSIEDLIHPISQKETTIRITPLYKEVL